MESQESYSETIIPQMDDAMSEPENGGGESDSSNEDDQINVINDEYGIRLLLSNARSLLPKLDSLKDAFQSLDLNIACITETWFKGGAALKERLVDYEGATGIKVLHKSRDGRAKKSGGGVAIAFNTANCNFKRRHLAHLGKSAEVLCVTGRVSKVERVVVVFVAYIAPGTRANELDSLREGLAVEIGQARATFHNLIILIGGDFNHRDVGGAIRDADDFKLIPTGQTRGINTINLVFTNVPDAVIEGETRTLPPLQAASGALSDHKCVYVAATFPRARSYRWISQLRRTRNDDREAAFVSDLREYDWTGLEGDVDMMAAKLREVIDCLTDKHFPLERIRKRSNESPWITRKIRRLWKRKVRIYKKGGRSQTWWDTDRTLQASLSEARTSFVDRMLEEGTTGKSFYAATRKLASAAPAK